MYGLPALQHCSADVPSLNHLWFPESCHRYFQSQKNTGPKKCELKLKKNAHTVTLKVVFHYNFCSNFRVFCLKQYRHPVQKTTHSTGKPKDSKEGRYDSWRDSLHKGNKSWPPCRRLNSRVAAETQWVLVAVFVPACKPWRNKPLCEQCWCIQSFLSWRLWFCMAHLSSWWVQALFFHFRQSPLSYLGPVQLSLPTNWCFRWQIMGTITLTNNHMWW